MKSPAVYHDLEFVLSFLIEEGWQQSGIGCDRLYAIYREFLPKFLEFELSCNDIKKGDPSYREAAKAVRKRLTFRLERAFERGREKS